MDASRAVAAVRQLGGGRYAEHSLLLERIAEIEAADPRGTPLTVQIEAVFRERPEARASAVAKALDCAESLVYRVRARVLAERRG